MSSAERAYNTACGDTDGKLKQSFETPSLSPETHRRPLMHREALSEINSLYEQRDCSVRGQMGNGRERLTERKNKKEMDRTTEENKKELQG